MDQYSRDVDSSASAIGYLIEQGVIAATRAQGELDMDYATLIAPKTTLGSIANWVNYTDTKIPVADIISEAQQFTL